MNFWLANDVKDALTERIYGVSKLTKCENRSLLLANFALLPDFHKDSSAPESRKQTLENALKKEAIDHADKILTWTESLPAHRKREFTLYTSQRIALGLANGLHENAGIDLHRRMGVPVITGSKLKGIANDEALRRERQETLTAADRIAVFGSTKETSHDIERAGRVAFLDGYPTSHQCKLELDVLTVHFPKYYAGKDKNYSQAEDTDSPIPAPFPVVARDQEFKFVLIALGSTENQAESMRLLEIAETCLKNALKEHGVGGKTRAGYGRFREAGGPQQILSETFDDLFVAQTASSTSTQNADPHENPASPQDQRLLDFVATWQTALIPDGINRFAAELRKLPKEMQVEAFSQCVPEERRVQDDALWFAFKNRHHGKELLLHLNIR